MGIFWLVPALIPILGILIILICPVWSIAKWQGAKNSIEIQNNWFKFGIYSVLNIVFCLLVAFACWEGANSKTKFNEIWNFKDVQIKYDQEWTEKITYQVTVDDGDTTDSDGHVTHHSHQETRHRTDHFGPYWSRQNEYGEWKRIDSGTYAYWKNVWKDEKNTGMHKGSSAGFDRSIDGLIFECSWDRKFETIYPDTSIFTYVNKIRVSNSVFNQDKSTPQQKAKYPRPADQRNTSPVILYGGSDVSSEDILFLRRVNADLGCLKQIHTMLVLFNKDASRDVVKDVLQAWHGMDRI